MNTLQQRALAYLQKGVAEQLPDRRQELRAVLDGQNLANVKEAIGNEEAETAIDDFLKSEGY